MTAILKNLLDPFLRSDPQNPSELVCNLQKKSFSAPNLTVVYHRQRWRSRCKAAACREPWRSIRIISTSLVFFVAMGICAKYFGTPMSYMYRPSSAAAELTTQSTTLSQDDDITFSEKIVLNELRKHYQNVVDHNDEQYLDDYFKRQYMELNYKPINEFLADIDNIPLYIETMKLRLNLKPSTRESIQNMIQTFQSQISYGIIDKTEIIHGNTAIFTGEIFIMSQFLKNLPKTVVNVIVASFVAHIDSNFTGRTLAIMSTSWIIEENVIINLNGTQENLDGGYFLGVSDLYDHSLKIWTDSKALRTETPWEENSTPNRTNSSCSKLAEEMEHILQNDGNVFNILYNILCNESVGEPGYASFSGVYSEIKFGKYPEEYEHLQKCFRDILIKTNSRVKLWPTHFICCSNKDINIRIGTVEKSKEIDPIKKAIEGFAQFATENRKNPDIYKLLQRFDRHSFLDVYMQLQPATSPSSYRTSFTRTYFFKNHRLFFPHAILFAKQKKLKHKISNSLNTFEEMSEFLNQQKFDIEYSTEFKPDAYEGERMLFMMDLISTKRLHLISNYIPQLEKLLDNTHQRRIVDLLMLVIQSRDLFRIYKFKNKKFLSNLKESNPKLLTMFLKDRTPNETRCQEEWDFCRRLLCAEIMLDFENCNESLTVKETIGYWWEYRQMFKNIKKNLNNLNGLLKILKSFKCTNSTLATILEDVTTEWEELVLLQNSITYSTEKLSLQKMYTWSTDDYKEEYHQVFLNVRYAELLQSYSQLMIPCYIEKKKSPTTKEEIVQEIKELQTNRTKCEKLKGGIFSNTCGDFGPFYTWKQAEIREDIKKLFRGYPITLRARLLNPLTLRVQGLKIDDVGIRFSNIPGLEEELENFYLELTHSGFSHYYFKGMRYVIKGNPHLLKRPTYDECSYFEGPTLKDFKERSKNYSPYTTWTIQLFPVKLEADINKLLELASQVDIFLVGRGWYVSPEI